MSNHPVVRASRLLGGLALVSFLVPLAAAQSLQTFVLGAGGDSSGAGCTLFASPPPVSSVFLSSGVFVPVPGLPACGVAGELRSASAPVGPLWDTLSIANAWGTGALDGSTAASARYGLLSASATSQYFGASSPITVKGTEGMARCDDVVTITSPGFATGQAGRVRLSVLVQGNLSTDGTGTADVELATGIGADFPRFLFRAQVTGPAQMPFLASVSGGALSGFRTAPGSARGSQTVQTLLTPFVFGTAFDLRLALLTYTVPGLTSNTTVSFQARIVGVEVFDANGVPVTDFQLSSATGTSYGAPPRRWVFLGNPLPVTLLPLVEPGP